ncbi:MAG TPA: ferrous iron transport protein B, partial [Desulfobacteraceae bacterium]|nr:ferrous iron transport protein B [Desulfobacteraceae bacterium]
REIKDETVISSYLGRVGRAVEPFTRFAGFNWRINISLISSFAAKESSVATLGSIYQSPPGEETQLGERMKRKETGWTPLHALAIMLFMAMYPPCIPTLIMVRLESGSTKWMLFATIYPIILGLLIAILVFSGGNLLGLSGIQAMIVFYILAIVCTAIMGFIKREPKIV